MRAWFKIGVMSAFVAFVISLVAFSSYGPFYSLLGKPIEMMSIFYGLIFVSLSFFTGTIVGIVKEGKCKDRIDYYSKLFVIIFNVLAFSVVIGFGFSLEVWKVSLNNTFTWISIFAFVLFGLVIMAFVFGFARKKLKPRRM